MVPYVFSCFQWYGGSWFSLFSVVFDGGESDGFPLVYMRVQWYFGSWFSLFSMFFNGDLRDRFPLLISCFQ